MLSRMPLACSFDPEYLRLWRDLSREPDPEAPAAEGDDEDDDEKERGMWKRTRFFLPSVCWQGDRRRQRKLEIVRGIDFSRMYYI